MQWKFFRKLRWNKAIFGTNYSWLPNELYVRKVAMKKIFGNIPYQSII